MRHPVVHFEVAGKDAKKLQTFYEQLFDWRIDADNELNYGYVEAGDGGIAGGIAQPPGGSNYVTFYVRVDDLEDALKRAEKLGAKTVLPPVDVLGGLSIAQFTDPEGNFVGLVKQGSL